MWQQKHGRNKSNAAAAAANNSHGPLQLGRIMTSVMTLILLNMDIISIIALEQQKHRSSLHITLSSEYLDGWTHWIVINQSFGINDLKCCKMGVDAACDYGFGVDNVIVEIIIATFVWIEMSL